MDKIFNLKIDTKNKNITTVTGLKQFDNNSILNITLLQNSLALDLSNCTVRINFLREDERVLLYMANINNAKEGKVSIKLSPEVLEKAGVIQADISVFDSNLLKITSATFNMTVEKAIYNSDTYFSNEDLDLMQQEYIKEKERQQAEGTRKSNETTRIQAETKRNSNENTRISNEEARKKAENTRVSEWNSVKKDATNIKNNLETTIDTANKTNSNLQSTINKADTNTYATKGEINTLNSQYEDLANELKENSTKTITKNSNIVSLENNVEGIANIQIGGNTLYKRKNNTYTDTFEEGCTLDSVGENERQIEIKSVGKNLCPTNPTYWENGDVTLVDGKFVDSKVRIKLKEPMQVKPNTKYTLSKKDCNVIIRAYDINKNFVRNIGIISDSFITQNNEYYISVITSIDEIKEISTSYINLVNIQIEESLNQTKYEPYKEDKTTIRLKEPLRGLPNGVRDTVNSDGTITRRVGKVVLDGSEKWYLTNIDSTTIKFSFETNYINIGSKNILCNEFIAKESTNDDSEGANVNNGYIGIRINESKLSTPDISGFKKWLSENPTTVYYELAEPITETINQPITLQSFINGTIQVDTEVAPYITVKYPSNLNSRITTVEEATSYMKDSLGGAWRTLLILADKELKMKSIEKLTETDTISNKINEIIGVW